MGKKSRPSGAHLCVCDKCGARSHSIKETKHRFCGSSKNTRSRAKSPGTWHSA